MTLQACCVVEDLRFSIDQVPVAILNQEYNVIITAYVSNNPADDSFEYTFEFTGNLPDGLTLITDPENRRVIIQGTPIELGSFDFILRAKVRDKYDENEGGGSLEEFILVELPAAIAEDTICENHYEHEQLFTINVVVM